MPQPQKTPSQHNSTLYISPLVNNRQNEVFVTPPNPAAKIFGSPGSENTTSFFNVDRNVTNNGNQSKDSQPLSQAEKLRLWRHDALMQHQYKTAEFIGDKVLALTSDPNDAFWLAQVYFSSGNYLRAKSLLMSKPEFEKSVSCRYLAAFCLIKLELWDDALDLIGESNPFRRDEQYQIRNSDGGIKLESSMCYLRGLIFANQNNFDKAKEAYKEAVFVDVKCFEAFNELITNNLMTPSEEWEFITQLNYSDADNNDELVKLLYSSRLSKYFNVHKFDEAETILKQDYDLGDNTDILLARADYLYVQCNFDECLSVCERVLSKDQYNFSILPNYLSCLHELGGKNKLFLKAHQLAESHPTDAMTWLAIGVYYLSINKIIEARRFFSKATLLNPNFGQAWIGFAHTFAAEGEHEQAISAYAFAARLFPGTHLPNLFLGMQHLLMDNLNLAEEYLSTSYQICNTDPLLLNELGVIHFHKNDLVRAEAFFKEALTASKNLNSDSQTWICLHANLGHVYRKANELHRALECYNQVLRISDKNDTNLLASIGLVYLKLGNHLKSISFLHDALAISPSDPVATDLLKRALSSNQHYSKPFFDSASNKIRTMRANSISTTSPSMEPQKNDDLEDVGDIARSLKMGEVSSDEDEEVMDIESD
ncbi:anaphase-promoting complex subunit Cut9 [Yamadazyma tenuis]|uniref:TPR-like protein n=1 Tax=Candida tenuis (strain ATCC 10573 / BCRC 21748 / CBS 615 / JCM 9827 / NBRC 10315 / NRRL Y-1498 / VKM Y-70) TaxID=590646 RepID=G3B2P7_CANTC|nr:uncharacterized protein CANTEDRAFT_134040 [Yamadazyma tenuis ATCC 10573]EGV64727.1 hypothetical protein CANTEDRAFT_134040 [Yamadazyma tenuis ATCC 10573]WEJ97519.1 anaphase-promoting complex subunit Cut9 [Yamadazyma tenuis]